MRNVIALVLVLIISLAAHADSFLDQLAVEVSGHDSAASKPIGPEYPVANVKKVFTVKIVDLNYTTEQKEKLSRASYLLGVIFNSKEYREAVYNHVYKNKKAFDSSNGLTNEQIYEKLFAGAEALLPAVNYQMDLQVKMYSAWWSKVVGYTYSSSLVVNTNDKFHNRYTPCNIASNFTHEWTHKMGFDHDSAQSAYSVPYGHNAIIEMLCPLAENGKLHSL